MKIVTVVGARPQFIKAAVVSRALINEGSVREVIIHTGQHFDKNMSQIFFDDLNIPLPHYNLGIGGGTHGQNTGRMIEAIEGVLLQEKPDWLMVFGDTDSTMAGAIAASKLNTPVAHVEAGLRSFNRHMPEEINRIVTDHVSTVLFAPSEAAKLQLIGEGVSGDAIKVVGDVMYDATIFYRQYSRKPLQWDSLGVGSTPFMLCTIHRAENADNTERLKSILLGLSSSDLPIIFPVHPRTRLRIAQSGLRIPANVKMTEPVGYFEMVWLEAHSTLILTDSGGVQKEAFFHQKPCVVLREETEWMELVKIGANILVGADREKISKALFREWDEKIFLNHKIYGSGSAGEAIVQYFIR